MHVFEVFGDWDGGSVFVREAHSKERIGQQGIVKVDDAVGKTFSNRDELIAFIAQSTGLPVESISIEGWLGGPLLTPQDEASPAAPVDSEHGVQKL